MIYEDVKKLWKEGEIERAYSLTRDEKLKDLINMINAMGGIENVQPSVVFTIVIENEYLLNLLMQEHQ